MTDENQNPYRQAREVESDALSRMTGPSPKEVGWDEGFTAGRAAATPDPPDDLTRTWTGTQLTPDHATRTSTGAATPDPPDDDKRVRVTCFDPVTGESETQPLDPDNYILTLGERCEIKACQVYANGTVQLTIKRGAT